MRLFARSAGPLSQPTDVPKPVWRALTQTVLFILVVMAALQMVIDATAANCVCVSIALMVPPIVMWFVLRFSNVRLHPMPALAVLLFVFANMTVPLIIKTIEEEPVVYNLRVPVLTFTLMAVTAAVFTGSYLLYVRSKVLARVRGFVSTKVLIPLSAFKAPPDGQLVIMGLVGTASYVYVLVSGTLYAKGPHEDSTLLRFVEGFMPLAFAPFLILVRHLYGRERSSRLMYPLVGVQFIVVGLLGMGENSRTPMLMPLVNLGVWILLGVMTGLVRVTRVGMRNAIVVVFFAILLTPAIENLVTAMAIVRGFRQKIGPVELISRSFDYMSNTVELEHAREQHESAKEAGYNSVYVHNALLTRFIDVKFHDNSIGMAEDITPLERRSFRDFAVQKAWSILPTPVLALLGVDLDKDTLGKESFGDFLFMSRTGGEVALRTGSYIANGIILHDYLFFPILGLFCLGLFTLFDSFLLVFASKGPNGASPVRRLVFSPLALLNVYLLCGMFLGLNGHESEVAFLAWIVRDFAQIVVLYFIIFKLTAGIMFVIGLGSKRRRATTHLRALPIGRTG